MTNDPSLPVGVLEEVERRVADYLTASFYADSTDEARKNLALIRQDMRSAILTALAEAEKREREACAKVCDGVVANLIVVDDGAMESNEAAKVCAQEIRARSRAGAPHAP